ncbi:MAG: FAD-dependent oxidoreductase, partial [Rubrivivax sp.]|nr:FAD-dependent oxidoreductase [Rubrivivax sp.]
PDPAKRQAWLEFVVIGGGPTGVELAGTLAEIAQHTLRNEFRIADPARARVHLVEAGPRVLASMPESLSASALRQLDKLRVLVHTGTPVTAIDAEGVTLGGTQRIESRVALWAAGVAASPLGAQLGLACDRQGRVPVAPDLSVPAHPEVFVIGDLASVTSDARQVPGIAPAAKQMGNHAARAIRDRIAKRETPAFRYRDYGNLATIGRMAAVVDLRGLRLSGLVAWWFWLAAHVFFLIGFRNRLIVLLNWAWAYWTYQRHARIVLGGEGSAGNDPGPPPR